MSPRSSTVRPGGAPSRIAIRPVVEGPDFSCSGKSGECGFYFRERLRRFEAEFGLAMNRSTQLDGLALQRARTFQPIGNANLLIHGAILV